MESVELKKYLQDIGESIHSMNTIAVALSSLPDTNVKIPNGLEISWKPHNVKTSKIKARNYAERSSYIYAAESLFEYLNNISRNPFWTYEDINLDGDDKKAIKVFTFLNQISGIEDYKAVLCELLCHWRNRIVHLSISNASLSSKKKQCILEKKEIIYSNFHHFDVAIAIENYKNKKVTLKDASTLITISIKCARLVDEYFFKGISKNTDISVIKNNLLTNQEFQKLLNQSDSEKKQRQLKKWFSINFPYLSEFRRKQILYSYS